MSATTSQAWTFESLRDRLSQITPPAAPGERETLWVAERVLGVARSHLGAVELFVVGPRLHPRTSTVRRHMEHGQWLGAGDDLLEANRIVLPAEEHFVAIGALIAVEMLRAGTGTDRPAQAALEEVEPIIELALRRGALSEESVVGLLGELLALEQMLLAAFGDELHYSTVLDMWRGHQRGERDFAIGTTALEVKTTSQESSSHTLNNLHQVETEAPETRLLLLSVGLAPTASEGQSLPEVVDRILGLLGGWTEGTALSGLQQRFLRDVAVYGSGSTAGYDHLTMSTWAAFQASYRTTFTPRLYDLCDPEMRLLRRADLHGTFVDPTSVRYIADLPLQVNGRNPMPSWSQAIMRLVRDALSIGSLEG